MVATNLVLDTDNVARLPDYFNGWPLANETNLADDVTPYYWYLDMDTFRKMGLHLHLVCTAGSLVATVQATGLNDGTPPASIGAAYWEEKTNDVFGVANVTATATTVTKILSDAAEKLSVVKWVRLAVLITGTSGSNTVQAFAKQLY